MCLSLCIVHFTDMFAVYVFHFAIRTNIPHFTLRSRLSTLHIRHPLLQLNKFSAAVGNYIFWCSFVGENMSHESSSLNCGMGMFCFFCIFARILYALQNHVVTRLLDMIWLQAPSQAKHTHLATEKKNYGNKLSCKSGLRGVHSGWIQVIWSHPEQLWLTVNEDRTWVKRCTVSRTIDVPQMGCHHG